jgi:hypothetical protein
VFVARYKFFYDDATTAFAVAPDPEPPDILTVGAEVYPEPGLFIITWLIALPEMIAEAFAFVPPPPVSVSM